ncbi:MAG: hypothetical protein RL571_1292 [Pseudomonadota bacterium]|jgi:hypothetical protein
MQLSTSEVKELCALSKTLMRAFENKKSANITLQFVELCEISNELFKEVKEIRKEIKDIISDNQQALADDSVGALSYVAEFRKYMGPALARSILLRNFANMVDAVLLAQIQYSAENVEIELLIEVI